MREGTNRWVRFKFAARMAIDGILSNRLRSILTILGVVIGVASVVSLFAVGEGARLAVVRQFESLGTNVIEVESHHERVKLTPELADEIRERVDTVTHAMPALELQTSFRWRREQRRNVPVLGTTEEYPEIRNHEPQRGHFFTSLHVKKRIRVAILGAKAAEDLFQGRDPLGQKIYLNRQLFKIMGVLPPKGKGMAKNIDEKILVPITAAQSLKGSYAVDRIWLKASNRESVDLAVAHASRLLNRALNLDALRDQLEAGGGDGSEEEPAPEEERQTSQSGSTSEKVSAPLQPGEDDSPDEGGESVGSTTQLLTVTSLNEWVAEASEAQRIMTLMLGAIAGVSLLVGGLGIMNIMLVSVTERTSEIGLRKAVGATRNDILNQFLLEALFISLTGAAVGTLIGVLTARLLARYGFEAVITTNSLLVASFAALGVGVIFGVYPALNASELPPVEALRRR